MKGEPHPRSFFEDMVRLRDQGLPWTVVAERLGVTPKNAQALFCQFRRRGRKFLKTETWPARREDIVRRFLAGERVTQIARSLNRSPATICMLLGREGFDAEERRLVRLGLSEFCREAA